MQWNEVKGRSYLLISLLIVGALVGVGQYYAYTIEGSSTIDEKFPQKGFDIRIKVSNENNNDNGFVKVSDNLHFDIDITNKLDEPVILQHQAKVEYLRKDISEADIIEKTIAPKNMVSFSVIIPMEQIGNNKIHHIFRYYTTDNSDELKDITTRTYGRTVLTFDQALEIAQYVYLLKIAGLLAIPVVLGSAKILRDLIDGK